MKKTALVHYILTSMSLSLLPFSLATAAGLERTTQSVAAFLQPNNYFEAGISVLSPTAEGQVSPNFPVGANAEISNIGKGYYAPFAGLKFQLTDRLAFGLLYDQPFGTDSEYPVQQAPVFSLNGEATQAEVSTENLTMLLGYKLNDRFQIYAGPAYQTVSASAKLRGYANGGPAAFGLYNIEVDDSNGVGWVTGLSYEIPEIALKTSLTYRSKIEHDLDIKETRAGVVLSELPNTGKTTIETPQSVNLDLQTGIANNTLAFTQLRWVNWKDFTIQPYWFGKLSNGLNLLEYPEDQYSVTVGVARKLHEKFVGSVSLGWDSGTGEPVSMLGPVDGYWNVGLGAKFSPASNYDISLGVRYFMFGDGKIQSASQKGTDNYIAEFKDSTAWAYALKIAYKF